MDTHHFGLQMTFKVYFIVKHVWASDIQNAGRNEGMHVLMQSVF